MLHLDSAACGRASVPTRDATTAHARREAEVGGYVAEAEAAPVVERLRADLAALLGVPADGVALVESATAALEVLLRAWPLTEGAVGVTPGEWGPNLETFAAHGLIPVLLPVDGAGLLDLDAFRGILATRPPALVHLDHVAAHRGLRQPVAEAAALCREAGVPLWVDAAQAVGQVTVSAGDAVYGTSRKWLRGPRGVGFLGIAADHWSSLRTTARAKFPGELPGVRLLESEESHVAGRVGLATALTELLDVGVARTAARLDEVGEQTRLVLSEVSGWAVVRGQVGPVTALRPTVGQDVVRTRERLLDEHRILTTACLPWRAPYEMVESWLRVSPHADAGVEDLLRLASALRATEA